jgi:hypothetical protein
LHGLFVELAHLDVPIERGGYRMDNQCKPDCGIVGRAGSEHLSGSVSNKAHLPNLRSFVELASWLVRQVCMQTSRPQIESFFSSNFLKLQVLFDLQVLMSIETQSVFLWSSVQEIKLSREFRLG